MTKNELIELIREEIIHLINGMSEQTGVTEEFVSEASKPESPNAKGKRSGKYVSAGTVPKKHEPQRAVDVERRQAVGKKLLNRFHRGNVRGTGSKKGLKDPQAASFRKSIRKKAAEHFKTGKPTAKQCYSFIWAAASDIVARGGTASTMDAKSPKSTKKSSSEKSKKSKQPSATKTPSNKEAPAASNKKQEPSAPKK